MSRANVSRYGGDQWQARWFWLNAVKIIDPASRICGVAWERGPKSVDDIVIDYRPARSFVSRFIERDYVQCKWHVAPDRYGYERLTDPAFINADTTSWLQRCYSAYQQTQGQSVRFVLKTNRSIDSDDVLGQLYRAEHGGIDLDKLYQGKTINSKTGAMRACWRNHLGISDAELRPFVETLVFSNISQSLDELRESLNDQLKYAGLQPEPEDQTDFRYDGLIAGLHQRGPVSFDDKSFRELCDRERLWSDEAALERPYTVGVRSFMHRFDDLEDRCDDLLDLVPDFDGRFLKPENVWDGYLDKKVMGFLESVASERELLHVVIDAHVSIAAAVGRVMDVKSGRELFVEQRGANSKRRYWDPEDGLDGAPFSIAVDNDTEGDVVIALSATHDVTNGVGAHCAEHFAEFTLVSVQPPGGPGPSSLAGGTHAWKTALQISEIVRGLPGIPGRRVHLFAAAPNALIVFLSQQLGLGNITVYEWDFEGSRGGGYQPGLTLR